MEEENEPGSVICIENRSVSTLLLFLLLLDFFSPLIRRRRQAKQTLPSLPPSVAALPRSICAGSTLITPPRGSAVLSCTAQCKYYVHPTRQQGQQGLDSQKQSGPSFLLYEHTLVYSFYVLLKLAVFWCCHWCPSHIT